MNAMATEARHMLIGGQLVESESGAWDESFNPATEEAIGRAPAATAGDINSMLIAVFVISGACTAIGGGLLSYGLAAASPVALADTLVPGAAAAILGGVSLSGGKGRPLGIAGGVLVLSMLRSGLTAIGVQPFAHWIVTAGVLFAVGILDSEELSRRVHSIRYVVSFPKI